jgi:hypothetical protein
MKEGQSAAAGAPMLRDTVEAPAGQPSSLEEIDSGDSIQPTSSDAQSATTSLPDTSESVENPAGDQKSAFESMGEAELETRQR